MICQRPASTDEFFTYIQAVFPAAPRDDPTKLIKSNRIARQYGATENALKFSCGDLPAGIRLPRKLAKLSRLRCINAEKPYAHWTDR